MSAIRARARRSRAATASSSSRAATTATPTRCSSPPARGSRRSGSLRRAGVTTRRGRATRSSRRTTTSTPRPRRSSGTAKGSRRSSSSRSPGTWASFRRRPASSRRCARSATRPGALLVFDEVITGFRVARGGAQERFGVKPDLTILGKIVGGGLPLAAFGGRADVDGATRAGAATSTRRARSREPARDRGRALGAPPLARPRRVRGARGPRGEARGRAAWPGKVQRVGGMLTLFCRGRVRRARSGAALLPRAGVYVAPSQYEAMFVSLAHGDEEIERTVEAVGARDALADDRV